eukprot:g6196.t1
MPTTTKQQIFAASPATQCPEGVFPAASGKFFAAIKAQGQTRFIGTYGQKNEACSAVGAYLKAMKMERSEKMVHFY